MSKSKSGHKPVAAKEPYSVHAVCDPSQQLSPFFQSISKTLAVDKPAEYAAWTAHCDPVSPAPDHFWSPTANNSDALLFVRCRILRDWAALPDFVRHIHPGAPSYLRSAWWPHNAPRWQPNDRTPAHRHSWAYATESPIWSMPPATDALQMTSNDHRQYDLIACTVHRNLDK